MKEKKMIIEITQINSYLFKAKIRALNIKMYGSDKEEALLILK